MSVSPRSPLRRAASRGHRASAVSVDRGNARSPSRRADWARRVPGHRRAQGWWKGQQNPYPSSLAAGYA